MIILENTQEYKDTKLVIPVGIGVVQTSAAKNFYNTSDADAKSDDILKDKTAYGRYGKLTGTLDLDAEKEISYQDGYETGKVDGYDSGYDIGYQGGYTDGNSEGYQDGYAEGLDDGIIDGRNEIIDGQNDATITPQNVLRGYIGYGKNNERIVGASDAITSIDVGASGIRFGHSTFTEVPSYYDFSNVTTMYRMFYYCQALTSVPLFDTSNVTDMSYMFYYCDNLTSVPLFDTSNVTDMSYMFRYCGNLTSVPLFDTSKVTIMSYMFGSCNKLTSVPELNCQSLTYMPSSNSSSPFYGCSKLESFGGFKDLGKAFTGTSSKTFYMGTNNQALTRESMINTFNALYDLTTTTYTGTATFWVSRYPYDKLTTDDIAIATAKGWVISRYNG